MFARVSANRHPIVTKLERTRATLTTGFADLEEESNMNQRRRGLVPCVVLAALMTWGELPAADSDESGASLAATREGLAKWVETQQILAKEAQAWRDGREILEQRIALLSGEIADVEQRIAQAATSSAEAERKRDDLTHETRALSTSSSELTAVVVRLEGKVRQLTRQLPDSLRERVGPLSRRIPENPSDTTLSLSQRAQNVIGVLNEVNKFNGNVTVTSELRALPDGRNVEVQALYVGLGQAYYVTTSGDAAGVGTPTPEGWMWKPADDLAPLISQAIAILRDEQVPDYVPLPVEIQ